MNVYLTKILPTHDCVSTLKAYAFKMVKAHNFASLKEFLTKLMILESIDANRFDDLELLVHWNNFVTIKLLFFARNNMLCSMTHASVTNKMKYK